MYLDSCSPSLFPCLWRACVEVVKQLMLLTRSLADAFGVLTVALVALLSLLGFFCIYRSLYFQIRILKRDFLHLVYFNGPWLTRITLVLVSIWWGLWEILRLTLLKEKLKLFSSVTWQKNVCKFYLLSNFGFSEPVMFLTLIFLLRASLQKTESGTLSKKWNAKVISYTIFFTFPTLIWQLGLIFVVPKFYYKTSGNRKMAKYFIDTSSTIDERIICTYPLFGTSFLALFYLIIILYAIYIGRKLLSLVINKGLKRRVCWLISTIFIVHPFRISLLALSVFLHPGTLAYEAIVFLAFCTLFFSAVVCNFILVYYPIADSLALKDLPHIEIPEMPFDDYYQDGASLIANQSRVDAGRSSDASTMRGSISFRTMIRDEALPAVESLEEGNYQNYQIGSSSSSPSLYSRPMLPLLEMPSY